MKSYLFKTSSFRPKLLHLHTNALQSKEIPEQPKPHRDEPQIRLDTDRSFVLYPVGDAPSIHHLPPITLIHANPTDDGQDDDRFSRQAELNKLLVQLFRKHPGLNYFQVNSSTIFSAIFGIYMRTY